MTMRDALIDEQRAATVAFTQALSRPEWIQFTEELTEQNAQCAARILTLEAQVRALGGTP